MSRHGEPRPPVVTGGSATFRSSESKCDNTPVVQSNWSRDVIAMVFQKRCRIQDSNLHDLYGHQILSLACLPIPPIPHNRSGQQDLNLHLPLYFKSGCAPITFAPCPDSMVRIAGFEPATSCSQSRRATKLRYIRIKGSSRNWTNQFATCQQPIKLKGCGHSILRGLLDTSINNAQCVLELLRDTLYCLHLVYFESHIITYVIQTGQQLIVSGYPIFVVAKLNGIKPYTINFESY